MEDSVKSSAIALPSALDLPSGGKRFSLSQRERAGVRENGSNQFTATVLFNPP